MNETSQADTDFYWMQERALRAEEQVEKLREALRLCGEAWSDFGHQVMVTTKDGKYVPIEEFVKKALAAPLPEEPRKEA